MSYLRETHMDTDDLIRRYPDALDRTPSGRSSGPSGAWALEDVYRGISFKPPKAVREAAKKGLRLRRLNDQRLSSSSSRGGGSIGVLRAVQLSESSEITPRAAYRMRDYLTRHRSDKKAKNFGNDDKPSPGYVAWLLWGGDPALPWVERLIKQMEDVAPKDAWKREPNPRVFNIKTGKVFVEPERPKASAEFASRVQPGVDERWGRLVEAYTNAEGLEARQLVSGIADDAASSFEGVARALKPLIDRSWPKDKDRRPPAVRKALEASPEFTGWASSVLGASAEYTDERAYNAALTNLVNQVSLYARPREIRPIGGKSTRMWRVSDGEEQVRRSVLKAAKERWISAKNTYEIPPEVRDLLPQNLVVRMDNQQEQIRVYDLFVNEKETLERKILRQKAYAANRPQIISLLSSDIRADDIARATDNDEYRAMAATVMLLMEQTGIRPSDPDREYYGAITLRPSHVEFVGPRAEIEFVGKAGTVNRATVRDPMLVRKLRKYVDRARERRFPQVFTTSFGVPIDYALVAKYFDQRSDAFRGLVPTTFRKLVAGRVAYENLLKEREDLYAKIRQLNGERADALREGVLKAVNDAVRKAVSKARDALSHKDEKTTIESYLNPELLINFLSTGVLADTFEQAVLQGATSVEFDPVRFLEAARSWDRARLDNPTDALFKFKGSRQLAALVAETNRK